MKSDTVIIWKEVNMKATKKNLPEEYSSIVYFDNCICTGTVIKDHKQRLKVDNGYRLIDIKTGFLWCYQRDIPAPIDIKKEVRDVNTFTG